LGPNTAVEQALNELSAESGQEIFEGEEPVGSEKPGERRLEQDGVPVSNIRSR
jgi:hypothetical protein